MTDGVKLASGYIELSVKSAGGAMKDIMAEITGVEKQADKSGKAAGKAINDGISKGAKAAGKSVGDSIVSSAQKAGADAGKAAGGALEKGVTEGAKRAGKSAGDELDRSIGESAKRTGKKAGDSIGGLIVESVRQGAKDAGWSLEDLMQASAKKAGAAIGKAIGDTPLGDWVRSIGIEGDQVVSVMDGISNSITGIKNKDAAGVLNGVATALGGIGQSDAATVIGDIATKAGTAQQNFSVLKGAIGGGADALKTFTGNADGAISKIGGIAQAASEAAGPVAAFLSAVMMGQQLSADINKKFFNGRRVAPQDGIPLTPWWFLNRGEAALNGKGWSAFNPFDDSPDTPGHGLPGSAPPGAPVQGPKLVQPPSATADYGSWYGAGPKPQTVLPPLTTAGGGATAAPSGFKSGGSPLAAALAANGSFSSEQIRLIQGFSKVEGNNPAGNPTLGFTDSQLGGASDLTSHVSALAKQFRDRAPVAGAFPAGGSDQQQAAWIAAVVGQNGSPSDWQGNAQPPAAVYQQRIISSLPPIGFDDGGQLLPGMQLVNNASGQPEIVLTQDQAKNAMAGMPGMGAGPSNTPLSSGQSPGENGPAALTDLLGGGKDRRTQGYIPAGAGGGGQAGTSLWSGAMQMGAQAINGLIDQAASAASSAASMGANAFAPGSGGAAGAAASTAIGIGTQAAKRGVQYGFQLAGIGGDALTEILMPFGVPRFFQTDPSQFMPKLPNMAAAVTTGEKAQQSQDNPQGAQQAGINPSGPVQPDQMPGQQVVGQPAPIATPGTGNLVPAPPPNAPGLSPTPGGPAVPNSAPAPVGPPVPQSGPMAQPQPQQPPIQPQNLAGLLGVFDKGGWLMPGGIAINQSSRPEPILNDQQWGDMHAIASQGMPMPDPAAVGGRNDYSVRIDNVTVKDVNELQREIDSRQRLQRWRYGGRP
ncbi:hypothetical protein LFT51_12765 [Mycobacterium intracellulare subsp. chimaera]|uniref:hypothetical protein n=1 Tax=Mycobacterium intracellulare TaxID=1767 RepID=UPI0006CA9BF5|nr:hypothetical protein [Mycobacterium intracellulare]ARV82049.1 hypothetical protein BWK49_12750 [Mycobacterium intracellulare subsp. chimaera]ASL09167.1 bacteriophage-like membrane protein [Mycobacterium intracellulare subsp. chimaera]ASL20982.1 bacteriophage-like membrane protein [Mycobacterium intracellulare subsp. chimaera]KPN46081.1 hypothetical protein AN931_26285 [Mycobacterium intracellulare subsp. chimaera]KPN51821.1 hypothetical protein AN932_09330 [Mycobacterium intracellulare subs